jgi:hypothetical protein
MLMEYLPGEEDPVEMIMLTGTVEFGDNVIVPGTEITGPLGFEIIVRLTFPAKSPTEDNVIVIV